MLARIPEVPAFCITLIQQCISITKLLHDADSRVPFCGLRYASCSDLSYSITELKSYTVSTKMLMLRNNHSVKPLQCLEVFSFLYW